MEKEYLKTFMVMISFHKNWIIIGRGKTFSLAFPQVRTGHFESFLLLLTTRGFGVFLDILSKMEKYFGFPFKF